MERECLICMDEVVTYSLECGHPICMLCWQRYLHEQFIAAPRAKSFLDITCPHSKCKKVLKDEDYKKLMSAEDLAIYQSVQDTVPDMPTSLSDFKYAFNKEGKLRHVDTGRPFHWVCQRHYDALGEYVLKEIQDMMRQGGLEEVFLPLRAPESSPQCNIFMTPGAMEDPGKLLLLIQGSGAVRPGQWARALCINEDLSLGTIFPYLERAHKFGYSVIVFNPNANKVPPPELDPITPKPREFYLSKEKMAFSSKHWKTIPENETPGTHTLYVWDKFIAESAAKELFIVAHSAGGSCTVQLLRSREEDVLKRLKCIAFTDSVHSVGFGVSKAIKRFVSKNAINWVQSRDPLDTPKKAAGPSSCACVSAGHPKHEYTSGCAVESVFKYLNSYAGTLPSEDEAEAAADEWRAKFYKQPAESGKQTREDDEGAQDSQVPEAVEAKAADAVASSAADDSQAAE